MSDSDIRWGILGPGRIAHRFADAVPVVDNATLVSVASRSRARAEAFAQQHGAPFAHDAYEDLAADDRVDAVYVATPHSHHFEHAMMCLEGGKHVVCEKPLTVNAVEAEALFDLSRSKGLFLMEAMWTLFLPAHRQVREWLESGRIGRPTLLTSTFGVRAQRNPKGRMLNPHLAGGALLDLGVYNIAVSNWVFGRAPESILAHGILGETGVDELTSVSLSYSESRVSQFVTTIRCETDNEFIAYGPAGSVRLHSRFWETARATLRAGDTETVADHPSRHNGFEYEIEEAVRCIRAGATESGIVSHSATLSTMRTLDAIRSQIGLAYPFEDDRP